MCWSGEASTAIAVVGLGTTAYAAYKKEPYPVWITLGYFSLMELLQAYTYTVIDQCSNPANQVATLLGYLHIAFQPFFINMLALYFVPQAVRERVSFFVYSCCFAAAIMMILVVYPFPWAGTCHESLCSERLCSVAGEWHIAWEVPLNLLDTWEFTYIRIMGLSYIFTGFLLPLLYGSWRFNLYHFMMGPFLASLLTDNPHEMPAIWCLLSIGFLLIAIKTPVRQVLHVKRWWLWFGLVK